jgi:leader peptidase (prepilin peptidase) / N-methyltransferase
MAGSACGSGSWLSRTSARAVLRHFSPARLGAVVVLSFVLLLLLARSRAWSWPTLALTPLIVALAAIVILDLATRIIPNLITVPLLVYALSLAATHVTTPLPQAVLGAIIGGALPLTVAIIRRGAVGGGDVKLMAVLGAVLGWKGAVYVFAVSHVAGALVLLTLFLIHRKFPRGRFPIGALISLVGAIFVIGVR